MARARRAAAQHNEPKSRIQRIRSNALFGHLSAMIGLILIAIIGVSVIYAFQVYGPFAAAATPTPVPSPSLAAADRTDLASKYLALAATTNQKMSPIQAQLTTYAANNGTIEQFKQGYTDYYNAEEEYLHNMQAVDWKGAKPLSDKVIAASQKVVTALDHAKNAADITALRSIITDEVTPAENAEKAAVAQLREFLGLPQIGAATPEPSATVAPVASPTATATPAPTPAASASN